MKEKEKKKKIVTPVFSNGSKMSGCSSGSQTGHLAGSELDATAALAET